MDPLWARNNIKLKNKTLCIQGNLNPEILIKDSEDIKNAVNDIMNAFLNINHIFNLGHGVIKTTPVDNIELLIDIVKNWKK